MRSMSLKRLRSFFTFDLPVNYKYLYLSFSQTHENKRHVYSRRRGKGGAAAAPRFVFHECET